MGEMGRDAGMRENCALLEGVTPKANPNAMAIVKARLRAGPQPELPTTHYFADGMYCRAVFRKKGVTIIGHVHKKEHFYMVLQGKVRIEKMTYPAGSIIVSKPGTERAVHALKDSLCVTVHRLDDPDCRDLEEIKVMCVVPDELALYDAGNNLKRIEAKS